MSDDSSDFTPQIILSVVGGSVILISEILPFVKKVKSNGVIQLLVNTCKTVYNKRLNPNYNEDLESGLGGGQNSEETDPLLPSRPNFNIRGTSQEQQINSLEVKIDDLNSSLHNISCNIHSCISDIQNSRQLKLQPVELYELNYIINYIKVNYPKKTFQTKHLSKSNKQLLISQGYIVDYDSHTDLHVIKW